MDFEEFGLESFDILILILNLVRKLVLSSMLILIFFVFGIKYLLIKVFFIKLFD